jgi:hypothetical protein
MTTMRLGLLLAGLSAFQIRTARAQDGASTSGPAAQQAGVTKDEIKKFLEAQLSEDAIIAYIERHPPNPPMCCDDLTDLKYAGAGDEVILALIEAEVPSGEQLDYSYSPADSEPSTNDSSGGASIDYYYYPRNPRPRTFTSSPPPVIVLRDRRFDRFRRPPRDRFWGRSPRPLRATPRPVVRPPLQAAPPLQSAPSDGVAPFREDRR